MKTFNQGSRFVAFFLIALLGILSVTDAGAQASRSTEDAIDAAIAEASEWPDFDSIAIGEEAQQADLARQGAAEAADTLLSAAITESCTVYDDVHGRAYIDSTCARAVREAVAWPNFDSIAIGAKAREFEQAKARAADEAENASLADAIADACTVYNYLDGNYEISRTCASALQEAAGWPDFDSIAIGKNAQDLELAKARAADEAAEWPDFDSTAIVPVQSAQEVAQIGGVQIP